VSQGLLGLGHSSLQGWAILFSTGPGFLFGRLTSPQPINVQRYYPGSRPLSSQHRDIGKKRLDLAVNLHNVIH